MTFGQEYRALFKIGFPLVSICGNRKWNYLSSCQLRAATGTVEPRAGHFQSFTLHSFLSVLLQNGHPGGQVWLWESAAAEHGHVSVHQPQTAGGGAAARPGLPDQQQVGHLLDHHILSVTCTGFLSYLNHSELLSAGCAADITHCVAFVLFFFFFCPAATKLVTSAFSLKCCCDISQISGTRHLDDTSGNPLASRELAHTAAESIW